MLVGRSPNFTTLLRADHQIPGVKNGGITKSRPLQIADFHADSIGGITEYRVWILPNMPPPHIVNDMSLIIFWGPDPLYFYLSGTLRGWPLMICGGAEEIKISPPPRNPWIQFFFLGKPSQNFFFSWRVPLKISFFSGECLSKFIFSWRVPLNIYFFLESASQNLFFPGEGPLNFFFSISSGPTPRSLMAVP